MPRAWSFVRACLPLVGLIAACAAELHPPGPDAAPVQDATVIAVLPDTQFYACGYPQIFLRQTEWIAAQAHARGIGAVIHTGDIVDADIDAQWSVAAESMQALLPLPYTLTSGNHDLSALRASLLPNYFPTSELQRFSAGSGTYDPRRLDNSYAIVEIAGRSWLLLGLEFGPRTAVVAWAAQILAQHAELPTILFTHAYLYSDGRRYDRRVVPMQPYHPDSYGFTPEQGTNDGEDLWLNLVEPFKNVKLVLSGHVIPIGTAHASSKRADGSVVHEVLANYQQCDACPCAEVEGGGGYLRLLEFSDDSLSVTTYSPYYDRYLEDSENKFTLPL